MHAPVPFLTGSGTNPLKKVIILAFLRCIDLPEAVINAQTNIIVLAG
jgi:hypothetical protein